MYRCMILSIWVFAVWAVSALSWATAPNAAPASDASEATTGIQQVAKPLDKVPDRRARRQPTVPDNYKEIPFVENAPTPTLTQAERQRGYMVFQRPIMEPVYTNTRPRAFERLEQLVAFATPGEYEPLTFSLYPVRDLKNLRVRISDLTGPSGTIPKSEVSIRLLTYWNIGFPRYTSRSTYRRLPELLERVSVHTSAARECQRWWLRVHIPDNASPGIYRGAVTLWDDGFEQAVSVPVAIRVLGFHLVRDPAKHYSVYYYAHNRVQFQGRDEPFIRKAMANERRAMVAYGIDTVPTLSIVADSKGMELTLRNPEVLDSMLESGLTGPVPVTAGNAIERIYSATTPDGRRESHWRISKMPSDAFYERVTKLFREFEQKRRALGWPEMVCCPLDEVAASHKEFGGRVYKAVKDAGMRTYATKNPRAADAAAYMPYIDVWCSQPYSMPYDKIVGQNRYEYWSYPNHNAGEIKDRLVMCKGGRMTYGFGFWRSGYTMLVPWHWAWTPAPDQFDYLRGSRSGYGQRIDDDGDVIPAVYWECFREGRDDSRYLYTLQQAIWDRKRSTDQACRQTVQRAKSLLQTTWDAIDVQEKYLNSHMWPSSEFNARRWQLAMAIAQLRAHSGSSRGPAPSVLVANSVSKSVESDNEGSLIDTVRKQGLVEVTDLDPDFRAWHNSTKEGRISITTEAGRDSKKGLRWNLNIDHTVDGGEGGKYPIGWPRMAQTFAKGQLDLSQYDYLTLLVRVDSNRDEVADDSTPLRILIASHDKQRQFFERTFDLGDRQRVWIPIRLSIRDMIQSTGLGATPWKNISRVQLFIAERDFQDGTRLTVDIASIRLLRFKSPVVTRIRAPRLVMLPRHRLPVAFDIIGTQSVRPGSHRVAIGLVDSTGRRTAYTEQDLADGPRAVMDLSAAAPGGYQLTIEITPTAGGKGSSAHSRIECLAGPLSAAP